MGATVAGADGAGMLGWLAPPDYQQGDTVKIMFLHVPAAWTAMMGYGLIAVCALFSLVWRHPCWPTSRRGMAAPLGAVFTLLGLVTGSLWGKPMWGAWWVSDARLTSFLLLLFLYLGLTSRSGTRSKTRRAAARACAILALVGAAEHCRSSSSRSRLVDDAAPGREHDARRTASRSRPCSCGRWG